MTELLEIYWPYFLVALLVGLGVAWFVFVANRKTSVVGEEKKDVLDEGAERAQRNQALIDTPRETAPDPIAAPAVPPVIAPAPATAAVQPTVVEAPETTGESGDDLTVIKGLGPKLATLLNSLGVSSYAQIASWDDAEIDRIDAQLDRFKGRIRRDNWVEQAKLLAAGDQAGFTEKYGQNG